MKKMVAIVIIILLAVAILKSILRTIKKKKKAKNNYEENQSVVCEEKRFEPQAFLTESKLPEPAVTKAAPIEEQYLLLHFVDEFFLKKEMIKNDEVESIVYSALEFFINEKYIIIPHVSFRELFACIKDAVPDREKYTVYCPKCKAIMKIKSNKKEGTLFYGCSRFPKCKVSQNISDVPPLYDGIAVKAVENENCKRGIDF